MAWYEWLLCALISALWPTIMVVWVNPNSDKRQWTQIEETVLFCCGLLCYLAATIFGVIGVIHLAQHFIR